MRGLVAGFFGAFFLFSIFSSNAQTVTERKAFGNYAVIQGATSDRETIITVLIPRLEDFKVAVKDSTGTRVPYELVEEIKQSADQPLWKVRKYRVMGLRPGQDYSFELYEARSPELVERRIFQSYDVTKTKPRFAFGSCMSDTHKYAATRDAIWPVLAKQKPDFVILNGDLVYVDGFEFVERKTANEYQIWQRYIDSTNVMPIFKMERLIPIYATWDDHDSGTDNANRTFPAKIHSKRIFKALFGSPDVKGVLENGKDGVYSMIQLNGQRIFLMDGRYFRAPDEEAGKPTEVSPQFGADQYQWLMTKLREKAEPAWIIQGDQFFAPPIIVDRKDGSKKRINESYLSSQPTDFATFLKDLAGLTQVIVFGSGDIHFSEVLNVGSKELGYATREYTSSPIHSFIYRNEGMWENPYRITGKAIKDHNFMIIESEAKGPQELHITATSIGAHGGTFFTSCDQILRTTATAISSPTAPKN